MYRKNFWIKVLPFVFLAIEVITFFFPRFLAVIPHGLHITVSYVYAIWIIIIMVRWRYPFLSPFTSRYPGWIWGLASLYWSMIPEYIVIGNVGIEVFAAEGGKYALADPWLIRVDALGSIGFLLYYLWRHLFHHLDVLFRMGYFLGKISRKAGHGWNMMVKNLAGMKIAWAAKRAVRSGQDLSVFEPLWLYTALVYAQANRLAKRYLVLLNSPGLESFSIDWKQDGSVLLGLVEEKEYFLRNSHDPDSYPALIPNLVEKSFL